MILFIDDNRVLPEADMTARTAEEAITALRLAEMGTKVLDEVWFDHDLGLESDIWDVVRFLETRAEQGRPIEIDQCVVHSMNPVGAERLMTALERAGYDVVRTGTTYLQNPLTVE